MNKLKSIYASAWASAVTIIIVTLTTISADLYPPFKNWLASLTGHHWVTKSWLAVILFAVLFLIFRRQNVSVGKIKKSLTALNITAILGFAAILFFYIYEFL
ncbi:MAG: hypothetical protein A2669_01845 [Candidatus Yanofskybacteria bacterium RIFCSPHIGHO2_01_FULL_48_25b]|uniref:DUF5658 domain-containing protein n=1 Tax=Candidatus Yanofskybacteria bacterium RIFCSPHIGHO2_01_FULL_48_25b TaxID=1802672 RepID=A0A1F8F4B1_9BACT|nr:MAG: hypothetical protein A2669_01845 [Candidatus Yanofskybacteria bacterium RIFCSPHIGHO2_01_FULL_48_25b]